MVEKTGARAYRVSVLDKKGLQEMVREIGAVDVLINNAGMGQVVPLA